MLPEAIEIVIKEAVTAVPFWLAAIGTTISVLLILSTVIVNVVFKDINKTIKYLCIVTPIALVISFGWQCVATLLFAEPTNQYRYEAIIDKTSITLAEYEEFIDTYHPTIKNDRYYWTGDDIIVMKE